MTSQEDSASGQPQGVDWDAPMMADPEAGDTLEPAETAVTTKWPILTGTDCLLLALIVLLSVVPNWNSLQCGFFSDDFLHFPYLRTVFDGHFDLLLKNFYGTWMDDDFLWKFYRPLTEVSIATDYCYWRGNPLGYHITNLVLHAMCSVLVFLLSRRIVTAFKLQFANVVAFGAAAIFAVYPLHVEVINWIVARDESLCEAYYFLSFWCFLVWWQDRRRWMLTASLAAFSCSLLSKEMAVSLPPSLVLLQVLALQGTATWRYRIVQALKETTTYWLVLFAYIFVRAMALGSFTGGYSGSFGDMLSGSIFHRFFSGDSFFKIFYPLNYSFFGGHSVVSQAMQGAYILMGAIVIMRVYLGLFSKDVLRCLLFALGWIILGVAPTVQIWGIYQNLIGSRLFYLGSAAFALAISLLIWPTAKPEKASASPALFKMLSAVSVLALAGLVTSFAYACYGNNTPWVETSKELTQFRAAVNTALNTVRQDKKLYIADLPRNDQGAHTFYSFKMLEGFLQPPLSEKDLSTRIVTPESNWIINIDSIDARSLKRALANENLVCMNWDGGKRTLDPVKIDSKPDAPVVTDIQKMESKDEPKRDYWYVTFKPDLPASAVDAVEVWLETDKPKSGTRNDSVWLYWNSALDPNFDDNRCSSQPLRCDGQPHAYKFTVAEVKRWLFSEKIPALSFVLPADNGNTRLLRVKLLKHEDLCPELAAEESDFSTKSDGVKHMLKSEGRLIYDASKMPGAHLVQVEISKRHSRFVDYSNKYADIEACRQPLISFDKPELKGVITVRADWFKEAGWYQIRVIARGEKDQVIGSASESVAVGVPEPVADK